MTVRIDVEMSTASKVTLVLTSAVSLGIIWSVHDKQVSDRAKLHAGIERDLERQAKKKVANQTLLVQQQELTKLYQRAEKVEQEGVKEN